MMAVQSSREAGVAAPDTRESVLRKLLAWGGVDVNVRRRGPTCETALHMLAGQRGGSASSLRLLVEHGADIRAQDAHGRTPLHYACGADQAAALLDAGAHPLAVDLDGWTPAHAAAHSGHAEALAVVLQRAGSEAAVHMRDATGMTPLHLAASSLGRPHELAGIPSAVALCLQHGADPGSIDVYGSSARDYAVDRWTAVSRASSHALAGAVRTWVHNLKDGDIALVSEREHRFGMQLRARVVRHVQWHERRPALAAFARAHPTGRAGGGSSADAAALPNASGS